MRYWLSDSWERVQGAVFAAMLAMVWLGAHSDDWEVKAMLSKYSRRLAAVIGGIIVFMLGLQWAMFAGYLMLDNFHPNTTIESFEEIEVSRDEIFYRKFGDIYSTLGWLGLSAASGLAFSMLFWDRKPSELRVNLVFWMFLVLLLPLSLANYWSADQFAKRSTQTIVDLAIAFCGIVTIVHLVQFQLNPPYHVFCGALSYFL